MIARVGFNEVVYIAGHQGFVGSRLVQELQKKGYTNLVFATIDELDLTNQAAVFSFFEKEKPAYIFLAAARSGGIADYILKPAQFMYDNLMMQTNIIHAAYLFGVKKILFYATACIYSDRSDQPIQESRLMEYPLDEVSLFYALPKLAGLKMGQAYYQQYGVCCITCVPVNLFGASMIAYGQGLVPSLIRKFVQAVINEEREVVVWGSGNQRREILHVDDLVSASIFLMHSYDDNEPINVGSGVDFSIKELVEIIAMHLNFQGNILYDQTKPEGARQKLLDSSKLYGLGWRPACGIIERLYQVIDEYRVTEEQKKRSDTYEPTASCDFVRR